MASLLYEKINETLLRKITDCDILHIPEEDGNKQLAGYLHSTVSKPYCRRLFSSLLLDDELEEVTYDLNVTTDESQDEDFVTEMLALGMLIEWTEPMVNSRLNQKQLITSNKESKFYSQQAHMDTLQTMYNAAVKKQRDLIRDRGYIYNPFNGGTNG